MVPSYSHVRRRQQRLDLAIPRSPRREEGLETQGRPTASAAAPYRAKAPEVFQRRAPEDKQREPSPCLVRGVDP